MLLGTFLLFLSTASRRMQSSTEKSKLERFPTELMFVDICSGRIDPSFLLAVTTACLDEDVVQDETSSAVLCKETTYADLKNIFKILLLW